MTVWTGKGKTLANAKWQIAPHDFTFGGRIIPKGAEFKQFETENAGWTIARADGGPSQGGRLIIAKE